MNDPEIQEPPGEEWGARHDGKRGARPGAGGRRTAILLLALALLSLSVYANALGNGFAFDDMPVIVDNERIHDLRLLPSLFTEPHWDNYRPVTLTTYALEWAVGDGDPTLHHATNVVLHAVVTCVLFLLLVRLGAAPLAAGAGAAVFAVHPVHVEAIANVVGRAELLVTLFALLALLVHSSDRPRRDRTIGVAVFLALALGSKENGVVVPALMVLVTAFLAPTLGTAWKALRRDLPVYAGVVAVGLTYGIVRRSVLETFTLYQQAYGFDLEPAERVLTAISIWPEYVRLLVFPLDLSIEYGPAVIMPARSVTLEVVLGAIVGFGCLALVPALWNRSRWVSLAVAWFALSIFPVSNVLIPIGVWLAERNLYLPSATVAMLVTALFGALLRARDPTLATGGGTPIEAPRTSPVLVVGALAVILALGSWRTWTRTPVWESSDTALQSLMENHPESFRAQWYMGRLLSMRGQNERALEYVARAVELTPGHGQVILEYARVLGLNGRPEEAEAVLREHDWMDRYPDWAAYMTFALIDQGRTEEALDVAREGVRLNPTSELALGALETARAAAAPDSVPPAPSGTVPP